MSTSRLLFWLTTTSLIFSGGCAVAPIYKSVGVGERAAIYFTSPYWRDEFLVVDRLALLVFSADAHCELMLEGRIPLGADTTTGETHYVPANLRLYLRLWRRSSDAVVQSTNQRRRNLSFVPEANAKYEVRHIDNPSAIRVEVYQLLSDETTNSIAPEAWSECVPTS
ncbi:MAG: hypothetical protein ACR2PZ_02460 [Pseudomonadales bacterium]